MCPDGLSRNREPEAETCSILSTTDAKCLKRVPFVIWAPATLVFHFDDNVSVFLVCAQRDPTTRPRVLACVVEEIHDRRREDLRIGVDRQLWIDRLHFELQAAGLGVQASGGGDVVEEGRDG